MNNVRASVEVNDWLEPPVEDDMGSLVGFNDDEQVATSSIKPVFNIQTEMRKPYLRKGMKFLNSKALFRSS